MSIKRVTIAQHERALVWKNGIFWRVLEPGARPEAYRSRGRFTDLSGPAGAIPPGFFFLVDQA
jgi:hypothetical protein